jgi:dsRNA-specific ribonuclease
MGESGQGSEDGSSENKTHSQNNALEMGNLEPPDERGVEISGQQTVQNGLEQEVEHLNNHAPQGEDAGDISHYTAALKEHGDQVGVTPGYDYDRISYVPPSFRARVIFGEINVAGEGKTKKLAKHRASKEAWIHLGLPLL